VPAATSITTIVTRNGAHHRADMRASLQSGRACAFIARHECSSIAVLFLLLLLLIIITIIITIVVAISIIISMEKAGDSRRSRDTPSSKAEIWTVHPRGTQSFSKPDQLWYSR
jgi:hypothetical protein